MGDTCSLQSFNSNLTSFMTQMAYEMDVDYVNYLYHKLFGCTCMFSIRGKHLISNHFNFAKT
jgi:hypothetical protein